MFFRDKELKKKITKKWNITVEIKNNDSTQLQTGVIPNPPKLQLSCSQSCKAVYFPLWEDLTLYTFGIEYLSGANEPGVQSLVIYARRTVQTQS